LTVALDQLALAALWFH